MHTEGAEQAIEAEKVLGPGMWQASIWKRGPRADKSLTGSAAMNPEIAAAPAELGEGVRPLVKCQGLPTLTL